MKWSVMLHRWLYVCQMLTSERGPAVRAETCTYLNVHTYVGTYLGLLLFVLCQPELLVIFLYLRIYIRMYSTNIPTYVRTYIHTHLQYMRISFPLLT